ncbi:hypothetical protein [Halopiger djelfimassiliensis]|nr:hypothetical protein [Halopiger djelfimassiliensis]
MDVTGLLRFESRGSSGPSRDDRERPLTGAGARAVGGAQPIACGGP